MNFTKLLAPRMELKYIVRGIFVYFVFTAIMLNGTNMTFPETALGSAVRPRSTWASTHIDETPFPTIILKAPEFRVPAAPYVIVDPPSGSAGENAMTSALK